MLTERDRTSFQKPGISDPSETACFLSFSDNPLIPQATDSPGRKRASLPKLRVFLPGESACFHGICENGKSPPPAGFPTAFFYYGGWGTYQLEVIAAIPQIYDRGIQTWITEIMRSMESSQSSFSHSLTIPMRPFI